MTADGFVNSGNTADTTELASWVSGAEPRGDWNLDGSLSSQDNIAHLNDVAAAMTFGGRGILSAAELDVRFGYAGYRWDSTIGKYHVRNRVYDPYAGRWLNRDPIEYEGGGTNLYEYVFDNPLTAVDSLGLQRRWVIDPPSEPSNPPPVTKPIRPSIGFYNPDLETWYGWDYGKSMAEAQYDCPMEAKSVQDMIDKLKKWQQDNPGTVPSRIGIIDHGGDGIAFIGQDTIFPGSKNFNEFMSLVDLACCVDFEQCNTGNGPEGQKFKDKLKKYYPDHDFDVNSGTCIVLPGGGSVVTPGWWKRSKWKLRDWLPWA